jgi:hypothetical protein
MDNQHTLSGLLRKRAELTGLLEHHDATSRQLRIDIDALDQTIRMFDPDIDLADVKPKPLPPRHAAYKGEVARIILGALRTAKGPLTTAQLAQQVMADRGMNTADKRLAKTVQKRVGSACRHWRGKGVLKSERVAKRSGEPTRWALAD